MKRVSKSADNVTITMSPRSSRQARDYHRFGTIHASSHPGLPRHVLRWPESNAKSA
jgi:hypothetical protein